MLPREATYHIYTRIETLDGGFRAVAVAIPDGQPLRCAPPSREVLCTRADEARRLAAHAARQLAQELAHRGLKCAA